MNTKTKFITLGVVVAIIIGAFLKSCITTNNFNKASSKNIDRTELYEIFKNGGVDFSSTTTIFADNEYSLLDSEWVSVRVSDGFEAFTKSLGMFGWEYDSGDCDDFSKAFTVYLKSVVRRKKDVATPAVGEVYYIKEQDIVDIPHAINFIVVFENNDINILWYEPQFMEFTELTESEIQSIYFVSI